MFWRQNAWAVRILLVFALAGVGFPFAWEMSAATRGQLVAHFRLASGHYVILTAGLGADRPPKCYYAIRERYGIEVRPIAGCIVTKALTDYADAHNDVMISDIRRKFGRDVFDGCVASARTP